MSTLRPALIHHALVSSALVDGRMDFHHLQTPLQRLVDLDPDVEPLTLLTAALTSRLVVVVVQSHRVRRLHPMVVHEGSVGSRVFLVP